MGSQHPQLLVIEGLAQGDRVLEDAWVLDLKTRTWRKVAREIILSLLYDVCGAIHVYVIMDVAIVACHDTDFVKQVHKHG